MEFEYWGKEYSVDFSGYNKAIFMADGRTEAGDILINKF